MKTMTCEEAKRIDLVDYLDSLGYKPAKPPHGDNYWYLSPLRTEKTPSFHVTRTKGVWFDFGMGIGGDIINFGTQYHHCSVSELLKKLSDFNNDNRLSFRPAKDPGIVSAQTFFPAGEKKENTDSKIVVIASRPLAASHLLDYLEKRCIPLEVAGKYCREVDFLLYSKPYTVIGFENRSCGFELRSENFKGSSSPKDVSIVGKKDDNLVVFEGFFSFLSFATIIKNQTAPLTNCLILNSLSFFEKSRPLMEQYNQVHLLLDRDNAGMNYTKQALTWNRDIYIDRSDFYRGRKDLNEWLIHHKRSLKLRQTPKQTNHFRR